MRRPDDKCSTPPPPTGSAGDAPSNAFAARLFEALADREPEPAVPEAAAAGPWRVIRLHGAGEPRFACLGAGEQQPRFRFEAPDLAFLAAAALALAERPARFRFQTGADGRLHLMHDGRPVATAASPGDSLPQDLTRLADLRARPLALAQLLVSVPQDVLCRTGALMMDLLREAP